jgi:hypothetical protein
MDPPTESPSPIRFEGTVNYPPVWFSHRDNWAQWFAEIHHPGPRNWVQSVSSSPVRPPKMIETLKRSAIIASVDFDGIEAIQEAITRLRTPQWPEPVLGKLDRGLMARGETVFANTCASCHGRGGNPPNALGNKFYERKAFAVGTDPVAYEQFAEFADQRVEGLTRLSEGILQARRAQLTQRLGDDTLVENYTKFDSKGLPNRFELAGTYGLAATPDAESSPQASRATYWAPPLEGIFATAPYLHNGSVPSLTDLLTEPDQRPATFRTGSNAIDPIKVGLKDDGPFVYDTSEMGKSNAGHPYGTTLPQEQKRALLEYLKSR